MHIEVIAIGNEVVAGYTINTNSAVISRTLSKEGFLVSQHHVYIDDPTVLIPALKAAIERSDLVIITGGLGSTGDDLTRRAILDLFQTKLSFNEKVSSDLIKRFGKDFSTIEDQSQTPEKAEVLLNTVGTAPGLVFNHNQCTTIFLPGVPQEMQALLNEKVIPYLTKRFTMRPSQHNALFHIATLHESGVDPYLNELRALYPKASIGIYPSYGTLHIQINASTRPELEEISSAFYERYAQYIFRSPTGKIAEALQEVMVSNKKKLALAESCTGGMIASYITAISGSSDYFLGSLVTYSNALKQKVLGVSEKALRDHGAVSKEIALEMLQGVFSQTEADYAISVTGIAGPNGGSPTKPIGTIWIAIGKRGEEPDVTCVKLPGSRETIICLCARLVLDELWRKITFNIPAFSS